MTHDWPELSYPAWQETCTALHLWSQVVGKVRLAQTPWLNHSWHVTFYVSPRGLATSPLPYGTRTFELEFDFSRHVLLVSSDDGSSKEVLLSPHSVAEFYADVMQARIERLAPGFGSRILARRVLGPRELEARNANLVGGSINGGTAQLHQQLVFRPVPGLGRAETPIRGLFLGSASAHPGGAVHGACGANAARATLAAARLGRI